MSVQKDSATGKWMIRVRYKDPITGKYKEIKRRGFETRKEAKANEAAYLEDIRAESAGLIKFKEVVDQSMEQYRKDVKESTYITKKSKVESNILPYFGDMTLDKITAATIKEWKNGLVEKGFSYRYKRDMYTLLNSFFVYAKKYYGLAVNPCDQEGNFKETSVSYANNEMKFWTYEEYDQFIQCAEDITYKSLFSLLYWSGCRLGEALALTWNDFTDGFKSIRISKSMTNKTSKTAYSITTPKNRQSVRTVLLPDVCIEQIKKLYEYSLDYVGFSSEWFAFGTVRPLATTSIERYKNNVCRIAGVKQIRLHDFRHSHASYLINNSPNDKNLIMAISKRLGHSNPTVTLKVYSHMFPNDDMKVLDILNKQK